MVYIVLTLLAIIITLIFAYLQNDNNYWKKRDVPYETPHLFVGNMKGIGKTKHFLDINERLYKKFKGSAPFAGMFFFFSKAAFIMDLELIKRVLIKDFSNFHDRRIFNNTRDDPLTGHLVTLRGEQWRQMRNKLTPVFTSGKMRNMFPIVVNVGENLIKTCIELSQSNDVELRELCARYTTDVIGTCAFGIECNSLKDPQAEFRQMGRMIFGKPRHTQLIQAFLLTNPELACKLRLKLISDEVSDFFLGAVRQTIAYRKKNNIKRDDFMGLLIEMLAKDQEQARKNNGINLEQGLTIEQMAAQVFSFFVAGFETSSTTMSFCLYELALNSDVQQKLRDEINQVLKAHNGELTYESLKEMQYLNQVIDETLRKYPVLPHIMRQTVADYLVPGTNKIIQKGNSVVIPVHSIHHDPEYYPEPEKFDPARFEPEIVKARHTSTYLPFGDGPRNCIGFRFGKMQSKIGIIKLLTNFHFGKSESTQVPLKISKKNFLISAEDGIHLHVKVI